MRPACTAGFFTAEARATKKLQFLDSFGWQFLFHQCLQQYLSWEQLFKVNCFVKLSMLDSQDKLDSLDE